MYAKYVKLRDEKGVTDYRVAEDCGISRSAFIGWKNGEYKPSLDSLQKLADYFDVSIAYFLE